TAARSSLSLRASRSHACFFFSSRRRHTRFSRDWSSDVCSSDLVRKLLSSYDVLGGPGTMNVLYTTEKFHDQNPKTYRAFYRALEEAEAFVKSNPDEAVDIYIRQQNSRLDRDFLKRILQDPEVEFTITPQRTFVYAQKMHQLGVLRNEPKDWKDYFFAEVHARPGS